MVPWLLGAASAAGARAGFDELTREQAEAERRQLLEGRHEQVPAMAAFRKSAEEVTYPSGELRLPGYLYRPEGQSPFPAMIWNHGSEKDPKAQPELARFYTQRGYLFFVPIRRGHAGAPGEYIVDLQEAARKQGPDLKATQKRTVELHELANRDVVAAVAWLKEQPQVHRERIVMSGVSYGGIQTLLTAEKGLGLRAFAPFAPAAMSFANTALRERLVQAARNAQAPVFLLQAQNDYSTGPSELLAPVLNERGRPNGSQVYPAFGVTPQQGHGAFACWSLGIIEWGEDVGKFLDEALGKKPER